MTYRGKPETWAVPIELIKERLDLDGVKVLDVGSGAGGFSLAIAQEGGVLVALDVSVEAIERGASRTGSYLLASAVSLPFREEAMDLIILNGVLEYTARGQEGTPRDTHLKVLRYIRRLLAPGGVFYLGIENRYYLKFILGSRDHYEMRWSNILPRELSTFISRLLGREVRHWIYSHAELVHLLSEAGFNYPVFYTALPNYKAPEYLIPISDMEEIRESSLRTHTRRLYQWVCHVLAYSEWLYRRIGPDFVILSGV